MFDFTSGNESKKKEKSTDKKMKKEKVWMSENPERVN